MCKPVKLLMSEQKKRFLTRNPENPNGHALLREQYSLPKPNLFKYGRAQGGISNIELEKLGIGTVRPNRVVQPKRVLPRSFRNDPFADPPPISETDIHDGMFSLLNRGIIPRDVDVSPAFDRGSPALTHQRSELALKDVFGPAHLQYKVDPAQIKYLRQMNAQRKAKEVVIDPEKEPDASLHRRENSRFTIRATLRTTKKLRKRRDHVRAGQVLYRTLGRDRGGTHGAVLRRRGDKG